MTISLCMIVKNEEENLGNCLRSVAGLFDEINIVDTGSTDRTVEIAKEYTDRIFYFEWINDFSAARNFSFSKATMEYSMWLDADDIMDSDNYRRFRNFKRDFKNDADCIFMPYILERAHDGKVVSSSSRERIVRNNMGYRWERPVHEGLVGNGKIVTLDVAVIHTKEENAQNLLRYFNVVEGAVKSGNCTPADNYYYGLMLSAIGRHEEAVEQLNLFIDNSKDKAFTGIGAFLSIYNSYIALGDVENAYKVLALNEDVNKNKSEYYCLLGHFVMNSVKDYDLAQSYFEKALTCNGNEGKVPICLQKFDEYYYFRPWNYLGQCFLKKKEYLKAKNAFGEALKYDPDSEELPELIAKIDTLIEKTKK